MIKRQNVFVLYSTNYEDLLQSLIRNELPQTELMNKLLLKNERMIDELTDFLTD